LKKLENRRSAAPQNGGYVERPVYYAKDDDSEEVKFNFAVSVTAGQGRSFTFSENRY